MSYSMAQARYTSDAAETVSPARLLTMLYDRLVTDLLIAEQAIIRKDIATTGERIGHAQDILFELYSTLDLDVWAEGEQLAQLYLWTINELMTARSTNNAQVVRDCIDVLSPLREAWHSAASGGVEGNAPDLSAAVKAGMAPPKAPTSAAPATPVSQVAAPRATAAATSRAYFAAQTA